VAIVEPDAGERSKMDREFRIWTIVTVAAVVVVLAMYIVPMI
jgi:hypothetical protein